MASQDLGGLGASEGPPEWIDWRWYYNVPSWPLWTLLLLLAVVPRHNHNLQAWLVLVLPLLAAGFAWLLQTLIPDTSELDTFGQFIITLAIAWACVWLLGPWLIGRHRSRTLGAVCGVMFVVGVVGYVGYFGLWGSGTTTWSMLGFWAVCSMTLIAAMTLTGWCGRGRWNSWGILFWPMLWMPLVCLVSVSVFLMAMLVFEGGPLGSILQNISIFVLEGLVVSGLAAGMLYILNLPVVGLCLWSPCYRRRYGDLFGGSESARDRR